MAHSCIEHLLHRLAIGEIVLADGAWTTQIQKLGLQPGECPEEWSITHPELLRQIAREYLEAGAECIATNTFGANRYRLLRHGLSDRVRELNLAAARLSREVADAYGPGKLVVASVGPTGEFLDPEGLLNEREMTEAFHEQLSALKEGGVDAVCIETMSALNELSLAIRVAGDLKLVCLASMTFDRADGDFKTILDTTLEEATRALDASGAAVIGSNCGNGMEVMTEIARRMRPLTRKPLLIKANAPMAARPTGAGSWKEFVRDLRQIGVNVIGGCCGTTPADIRIFRTELDRK